MEQNIWELYDEKSINLMNLFCNEYKEFLSTCKTERECIKKGIVLAEKAGFKNLYDLIQSNKKISFGDKVYAINMDKALMLFVVGEKPMQTGINIVGAHIDSPRLDLKAKPIYENLNLVLLDTHYYGGIKKYQWVATPLALHGVIVKKDGKKIDIVIGENEDEPVFAISDLLPHLEKAEPKKEVIKGEDLNLLAGSIPILDKNEKCDKKVKANILNILKQKGIEEDDLFSAEIEVVPAGKAKDMGLDRSMILGYGQDDRVCAFAALKAIININNPKSSSMCLLVDKEEIGSVGATGMESKFFENTLAEIMNICGDYTELNLRRCLTNSKMISSDVTAAIDPNYSSVMNMETDAQFAKGISFNKYTGKNGKSGANDSNPEFIAELRKILDDNNVYYQATEMGKVDAGGGGTIAYIMANYGMNVIDAGVPILNMHAPWEISCKTDIYESYKCYKTFYEKL